MKKLLTLLLLCFASFIARSQYTPVIANYTISGKPIGYSQATPADGRSMVYDLTNFLYRPYRDSNEVITYLNLAKYRAGNVVYIVDSGGTLNSNGTYTNFHATFWMFADGVADVNLIKLNWRSGGANGCTNCFFTTTQLTDSSFKLNRPNGTSDTVVVDFIAGVYIATLNNGLNLVGTNGQLGGPLVKNTVLNGGGFDFAISGNTFQQGQGAAIASANVMTTGHDGNSFPVIGSTQINAITTTNWQSGSIISFTFTGTPLLRNNQAAPAGSAPLLLAGGVDYTAATNDVIFFLYDGVNNVWHETSRKLAGSVIAVTANNGVSLLGSLLQWGGTLVKPTTVAGNLFPTFFSGGRVEMPMGVPILAAGDLLPGNDGIFFHITGTTQINAISTANFQAGAELSFVFDNIVTVKNNTVGGVNTAPMLLAGRVDYTSAVGDYIGFIYDGVNWYESARKLATAISSTTASNGLTLTGLNITLGGSLTGNTTIAAGTFTLSVSESGTNPAINVFNTSSGLGAQIQATSGEGAVISSLTGTAVDLDITPASTNTAVKIANLIRGTSGTPATGMGGYIGYQLKDAGNFTEDAGALQFDWADATHATFTSNFRVRGVTSGGSLTDWMIVKGNGLWNAPLIASWGNFANNAAALAGGLVVGDFYRNGDVVQIVH